MTSNRYSSLTNESYKNSVKNVTKSSDKGFAMSRNTHKSHVKKKSNSFLKVFSTNGAGVVGGKISSLRAQVKLTEANMVTVQETHAKRKGKIKLPDMVVFEAIRKTKGGGTLIAGHSSLNPKLIDVYEDEFELIVVEVEVKDDRQHPGRPRQLRDH